MRPLYKRLLVSSFAICLTVAASAQDRPADLPTPHAAIQPSNRPAALTGKERLGGKWTDEQRIDNCKVPIDKRGSRQRPDTCTPMG